MFLALGVVIGLLIGPMLGTPTSTEEENRRLRQEKRLLQELVETQKAQLEDINAVLEQPGEEPAEQ